jgi:hypothetical protein
MVKGFVVDASNGEPLGFAEVYLKGTELGSVTNERGYYLIQQIPPGRYELIASYVGYEEFGEEITIGPGSVVNINIELEPKSIGVPEVSITAQRARFEKETEASRITLSRREIRSVPSFFESDLIKIIQLLPGVVAMHDLSNKLYVRGGSPDENLVLLDGITVYNPSTHLFGLFSTFNPDAVAEVELISGGFPARYGDRLSAVLDVITKEGNSKQFSGEGSTGLISSKLLLEGSIPKGSFLLSGRRTYFDLLIWGFSKILKKDIELPYYFYDGVGKVNYNPSTDNRFTLAALGGADVISFEERYDSEPWGRVDLRWGNQGTSLRWRRVFTPKLYGELLGAWSNFFTSFRYIDYQDSTYNLHLYEDITDFSVITNFSYFASPAHQLDIGLDFKNLSLSDYWEMDTIEVESPPMAANSFVGWVEDRWIMNPLLNLRGGARVIYYGPGQRFRIDPRLGLKYRFRANTALNLALGRYSQFLTTLNSQESYFSIFDFWRPVDPGHIPPQAYHLVLGLEQWLGEETQFTVEGYHKRYHDLLLPAEHPLFFSFPSESLKVGNGYSQGLDLFFRKSYQDLYGWVSYSLSFTRRRVDDEVYAPRYDRRHNLNIVLGTLLPQRVPLLKRAKLDLRFYFATGLPYAGDLARYRAYYYDFVKDAFSPSDWDWRFIKGARDSYRYPPAHRLDLHLEKGINLFGLDGHWYFDLINLYGHKSIIYYYWEYYDPNTSEIFDPPRRVSASFLPYPIPSFGIGFKF